jgi:ribonuclease-3
MTLEEKLGYFFFDKRLLKRALTTQVYALEACQKGQPGEDQQVFCVLGSEVLKTVLTELLIRAGYQTRGDIIEKKKELESEANLARISEEIGVSFVIKLGEGEKKQRAYEHPQVLAETFEAVIGGVYLDGGYRAARETILRLFKDFFPET